MFTAIVSFFAALNSLSPLAVIALLGVVILQLARNKAHVEKIRTNDLHELPDVLATLQRIEVKLGEEFSYIRARLNGKT